MNSRVHPEAPPAALERIFHEPRRLAIMSALCAAPEGLSFNALKAECGLTDGNLSRHLKVLLEAGAIRIEKAFVDSRPRTTVHLREEGRESFVEYLEILEEVLKKAALAAVPGDSLVSLPVALKGRART